MQSLSPWRFFACFTAWAASEGIVRPVLRAAALVIVALVASCSSPAPPRAEPAPPLFDDDSSRLAHCVFDKPPARPTLPPLEPGAIRAGLGTAVLELPIGTPLGGYSARAELLGHKGRVDARPRRWAFTFSPSVGMHDAPRAEALALEIAGERWVLVRVDAPLVTARETHAVESALAPDGSMRGRVTVVASHSHSAWAAWQASLWLSMGVDRPRRDLFDRAVTAITRAARGALDAMVPARLGFAVDEHFDPEDRVNHDRRTENDDVLGPDGNTAGKGKDPVAWIMRVDRSDGSPLAAVVDVPIHGTIGEDNNSLVSTDAPGAIERALTAELGYPVLHVQGAAGDVSPSKPTGRTACPDAYRCLDMPALETLGARAAALLAPLVRAATTSDRAVMEVVTRSMYVGHAGVVRRPSGQTLWYAPPDPDKEPDGIIFTPSGTIASPIDEFNAPAGAALCGKPKGTSLSGIPGAGGMGSYASCLSFATGAGFVAGMIDVPVPKLPLCETARLETTAVRIGGLASGDWLVVVAPGEPTAPFTAALRARSPAAPGHTLLIGYGDHGGYLLTAEDWLAGGYETSVNVWGPLEGEMVIDGLLAAATIAWSPEREDPEAGTSRLAEWTFPEDKRVEIGATTDHGTEARVPMLWPDTADAISATPSTVARAVGVTHFAWYGGDPAVDRPEVVVERETSPGVFAPLEGAHGAAASSRDGAVVVTYRPDPIDSPSPTHHVYGATWQAAAPDPFSLADRARPFSLPLGRYRLHARGAAMTTSGVVSYEISSTPFDVIAAPPGPRSVATRAASGLDVRVLFAGAPGLRSLRDGASDGDVPMQGPWRLVVKRDDGTSAPFDETPDASGKVTVRLESDDRQHAVSVDVRDPFGNGGSLDVQ